MADLISFFQTEAVPLNCVQTVVFVSKSQSSWQVTEAGLSQIDEFEPTESNLETEPQTEKFVSGAEPIVEFAFKKPINNVKTGWPEKDKISNPILCVPLESTSATAVASGKSSACSSPFVRQHPDRGCCRASRWRPAGDQALPLREPTWHPAYPGLATRRP